APMGGTHTVTLAAGQVVTGIDFGNHFTGDTTNRNPSFTSLGTDHATATVGQLYRYDTVGNDPDGDPLAFDLPTGPAGMAVHPQLGVLVWEPTAEQAGVHPVVLRVQDGKGGFALQSFEITVSLPNTAPVITSTPPGPPVAQSPYHYQVRAQDAEG